jgi:hypothetical protein
VVDVPGGIEAATDAGESDEGDELAAATAASTSVSVPRGNVPSTSPLAGFVLSKASPSPATHSPST